MADMNLVILILCVVFVEDLLGLSGLPLLPRNKAGE